MGGICGIFNFDRSPVEQSTLEAMAGASSYRGRDGIHYRVEGHAGLAHQAFHTTPQSKFERQPSSYVNGRYVLAADARIDNREDLIPQLFPRLAPSDYQSLPDTEIIFAAYMKWGSNCPKSLIGDFAFVIWDNKDQRLFTARDSMGMRPFFYHSGPNRLVIASSIDSILQAFDSAPELNIPWIEDFVRGERRRWIRETIYKDILCLAPASSLSASYNSLSVGSYHTFGSSDPPSCKTDGDWIEAFRELFDKVVVSQLRSSTPVAIHLSGGLDSSSIACAAHAMSEKTAIPEVKLASLLYTHTASADEKEFIQTVVKHCHGFDSLAVYADRYWAFLDLELPSGYPLEEPDIGPMCTHTMALFGLGPEYGCRIALNGDMSNLVLGSGIYFTPQALRAVPYARLTKELKHYKKHTQTSYSRLLARAYLPQGLVSAYRRLRKLPSKRLSRKYPWLRDLRPINAIDAPTIPEEVEYSGEMGPVGMSSLRFTMSQFNIRRLAFHSSLASFCGMEWRIPYVDRRIVEFGLHLPLHLACSSGISRIILREAMRYTVPSPILTRVGGGHTGDLFARGFDRERSAIEKLLQNSVLQEMGIIDAGALTQWMQRRRPGDGVDDNALMNALPCLLMEDWLQRKFSTSQWPLLHTS